jgi:hypothetical protein
MMTKNDSMITIVIYFFATVLSYCHHHTVSTVPHRHSIVVQSPSYCPIVAIALLHFAIVLSYFHFRTVMIWAKHYRKNALALNEHRSKLWEWHFHTLRTSSHDFVSDDEMTIIKTAAMLVFTNQHKIFNSNVLVFK